MVNALDPGSVMTARWRSVPVEMKETIPEVGDARKAAKETVGAPRFNRRKNSRINA